MAYHAMLVGFAVHTFLIGYEFFRIGYLPAQNLHQTLLIAGWSLAGVYLLLKYRYRLNILGVFAAPLTTAIVIFAFWVPSVAVAPTPLFKSLWLVVHIIIIFLAEAALALACGTGILYLIQENAIKTKTRGFFFNRLPSLDLLDTAGYACIVMGFSMITIGLITGVIYAKAIWGRFWSWDPKEVWSLITWLFYAALLHERLTVGWRGKRAAIMAIIGFGVLLFTFLGVNFLLQGHHGTFTAM